MRILLVLIRHVGVYAGLFTLMLGTGIWVQQCTPWFVMTPPQVAERLAREPVAESEVSPLLRPVADQLSANERAIDAHSQELEDLRVTVLQQAMELAKFKVLMQDSQRTAQEQARHTATLARSVMKQQLRRQPHGQIIERPTLWGQVQ